MTVGIAGDDVGIGANPSFNNVTLTGLLFESNFDNITAAGNSQSTATLLTRELNRVTTATALQGVALPVSGAGLTILIVNHTAVAIMVYGQGADQVDDQTNTVGVVQMANSVVIYSCYTAGNWYTEGLATGFVRGSGLQTLSFSDTITALGTSQGTATPLTSAFNRVTSAAVGTGVNLPASAAGLTVSLINNSANPVLVYPFQTSSDTINGFAATTGVPMNVNSIATFYCETAGAWQTLASQPAQSVYNVDSTTTSHTVTAANITGANAFVCLNLTGAAGAGVNLTLPAVTGAGGLIAALHSPVPTDSYTLRIINNGSASTVWTILAGAGWTLNGTMTIALNTYREFVVTLNTTTTATLQSMGQVIVGAV